MDTENGTTRRALLDELRAAVAEYDAAVDALNALAEQRGQGDPAIPLIVREGDDEMLAAIQKESAAHDRVTAVMQAISPRRYRPNATS